MVLVELVIDIPKSNKVSTKRFNEIYRLFLLESGEILRTKIENETPHRTGALKRAWTPRLSKNELRVTNHMNYAYFVEVGTGLFGPRKQLITYSNGRTSKGFEGRHMAKKGKEAFEKQLPTIWERCYNKTMR